MDVALQRQPFLASISRHSDILLAAGVVLILCVMIIPLPAPMLDFLLAANIMGSLLILMVAMYITEPLQFSVFPGLLLLVTLFRLSLNVASTRLILGEAYAGKVISAFGNFVVKGNYVVGFVIFLILVVIQFIVITKGAGRIAEVAARFTLDAMPGKQMSIDADLNAGLIDDAEARRRREKIAHEADFYGAMDGASKFVRGDAIAGLIIALINILGGFIIGIVQNGMSFSRALETYTLLTVGDGLVSQIPALIISTAAGLVVTRAASESNLGQDVSRQIFAQPRALYVVAGVLMAFAMVPGLPGFPFLVLSALAGTVAYSLGQTKSGTEGAEEKKTPTSREETDNIDRYLRVDPLELEIGYSLIPIVDPEQGGDLLHRITMIRKQCALELGIVIPPIRIRDNVQLKPTEYVIKMRGADVAQGELRPGFLMALNPGTVTRRVPGLETVEPAFGLAALWIEAGRKEEAEEAGYTVVELPAVLATHLKETLKSHAHQLLDRQEVQHLIETVKKERPAVVEELIPNLMTLGAVQKVLQNLLREKVPIRDMVTILETLADYAPLTKDIDVLTEYVRNALGNVIYRPFLSEDGRVYAMTLDPRLEKRLRDALRQGERLTSIPNLPTEVLSRIYGQVKQWVEELTARGKMPLVLCSPTVRVYFKRLIDPAFPGLSVMSYSELPPQVEVKSIGVVRGSDED